MYDMTEETRRLVRERFGGGRSKTSIEALLASASRRPRRRRQWRLLAAFAVWRCERLTDAARRWHGRARRWAET